MAKLLVIIKGVTWDEYRKIRDDMDSQLVSIGLKAVFARMPAEYTEIETQWIDDPDEEQPMPIIFPPIRVERE